MVTITTKSMGTTTTDRTAESTSSAMETTENDMRSTQSGTLSQISSNTNPTSATSTVSPSVKSPTTTRGSTTSALPFPSFSSTATITSTAAHSPWKAVSFGLIGGIALLLLICIIMCIVLRRLKQTLGRAQRTYYHETMASEHSYTPLQKDGTERRAAPSVELRSVVHFEEEVDSPVFSPSPVTYPKPKPPPHDPQSPAIADTPQDIPPELPSRRQKVILASDTAKKNAKKNTTNSTSKSVLLQSTDNDQSIDIGVENKGFVEEEPRKAPTVKFAVDYQDDDDLYETYDQSFYSNFQEKTDEVVDANDIMAYEEPVKTEKNKIEDQFIKRQSSASGLPESVFKEAVSNDKKPSSSPMSLQDDDIYDNDEVLESGLPADIDPQTLDDLATYEDLDEPTYIMKQQPTETQRVISDAIEVDNIVDDSLIEDQPGTVLLSETDRQTHDELTADNDGDMSMLLPDEPVTSDMVEEPCPSLPDEPPPPLPAVPAPTLLIAGRDDVDAIYDEGEISEQKARNLNDAILYEEFPTEKELQSNMLVSGDGAGNQTETLLGQVGIVNENGNTHGVMFNSDGACNGILHDIIDPLPKVPPRRDLSFSENTETSVNDRIIVDNTDISDNNSGSPVQLRSPKLVHDVFVTDDSKDKNMYFLDVDDNSGELSEQQLKRISVIKAADQEVPLKELINLYGQQNETNSQTGEHVRMQESDRDLVGNTLLSVDNVGEPDEVYDDDDIYDTPPPISSPAHTNY